MKINEFIRLFVPPIYYKVKHQLLDKPEQLPPPLPKRECKGDKMIIIGNGPSMSKTLELYGDILRQSECMMVNFSASTPLYEDIKPSVYVMVDPGFLTSKENASSAIIALINNIVSKTHWHMDIVMPSNFRMWWAVDELKGNEFLSVLFDAGDWKLLPMDELFIALDKNIVCPPSYSVLSYCIYLSLYWRVPTTYLVGADTTFTQMVYVGQDDNLVYTYDSHYYDNKIQGTGTHDVKQKGRLYGTDMQTYLHMCYMIFYEYNLLKHYADWKGLKIYNASEYSMIDCFERRKLR